MPAQSRSLGKNLLVCGLLLLGVYVVFGQTVRYSFVQYDDSDYVYENPFVQSGLTLRGVVWAFLHTHASNWHPLTWISHMLDCQWFGLDAGLHHATNFVLHGISACLLFALLRRLTGDFWPSALVAAIFAVHPLRVESVAWVAERKDVLSGLFFFLTLLAYERYVRQGQPLGRYLWATLLLILGLMAKPMLVTLPFVTLLLDYWPLGRFREAERSADDATDEEDPPARLPPIVPLVMEKLPWMVLAATSCAITAVAQRQAMRSFDRLPLGLRVPNAVVSYAAYLKQAVWPQDLAVYYPHSGKLPPLLALIGAIVLLAGISWIAVRLRRSCPYVLVGWLWYAGMLVPVIGLVQVGDQAMADRYTYLPQVGLFIALAWGARSIVRRVPSARAAIAAVAALVVALSIVAAWQQTRFWRETRTLWVRDLACTRESALALNNLAACLLENGQYTEARAMLDRAVRIQPDFALGYYNQGRLLSMEGKNAEAIERLKKAVELAPISPVTQNELAKLLQAEHHKREAISYLENVLKLDPDAIVVQENLAWVLATTAPAEGGDPQRAVALAERLCRVLPSPDIFALETLAAAYAAAGRYAEAVPAATRAQKMAEAAGRNKLVEEINSRLKLYEAGRPYRE